MKALKQSILSIAIGLALVAGISYAAPWTGAPGNPPGLNTAAPINEGSIVPTRTGALNFDGIVQFNAGIPMIISTGAGPGKVLTSNIIGEASWGTAGTIPTGAVMHFNLAVCPTGWSEMVSAEGRYLVGLMTGGTPGTGAGTALKMRNYGPENRPAGEHNHRIGNIYNTTYEHSGTGSNESPKFVWGAVMNTSGVIDITGENIVAGTNAPYIQLLVCQKS